MKGMQQFINSRITNNRAQIEILQSEIAELEAQGRKAETATGIDKWVGFRFESSTELTEEFAQFAKDFKGYIEKALPKEYEIVAWNRGSFYISGFVRNNKRSKLIYFSVSDVRHFPNEWYQNVLVRTAEHEKDYTGGVNNYTTLHGFMAMIEKLTN